MYPGPVVSAVVHKNFAPPRHCTRCVNGVSIGLATGIREPHHFERWKALGHDGCCPRLVVIGTAPQRMAGSHGFGYRLNNRLGRVPKKSGCKIAQEISERLPVCGFHSSALTINKGQRERRVKNGGAISSAGDACGFCRLQKACALAGLRSM